MRTGTKRESEQFAISSTTRRCWTITRELINGLSLILEEPDFTNCSETSLAFLAEFLPPNSSENGFEIFERPRLL